MSDTIRGLNSVPNASGGGGYSTSPRQVGMGYGGYTGLDPREEAYARQFGDQAKNGNFWRGAAVWTAGAALAGGATVALERQWTKEGHSSYLSGKSDYITPNLTDEHYSLLSKNEKVAKALGDKTLKPAERLQAIDHGVREGFIKNSYKLDKNPYKDLNSVLNHANDYAKVQMNAVDSATLAKEVNLTKTTGLAKAGMVAGAVLAGGLLISHLSATGEGNATTQMARERLAQLKAQEAMAQRGMGQA
jgi:hypothetical protein